MVINFSADEVFEMAEEIERQAVELYSQAQQKAPEPQTKQMLGELADMEQRHVMMFQEMRTHLSQQDKEETVYDPENQSVMYLQTMADAHGLEGKKGPSQHLSGDESLLELLNIACDAEKNSIVFYTGIKEYVQSESGKAQVNEIIHEEFRHLNTLQDYLKRQKMQ